MQRARSPFREGEEGREGAERARTADRPWDRTATRCLVGLILGAVASLGWLWHSHFHAHNDASMYILVARNLLAGEGCTLLGQPFLVRPPGLSVLLMPLLAIWGTNFGVLNLFVNLFGIGAIALLFVFVRRRIGSGLAVCLAAGLWINPGFRVLCNQVMSDVPGLALGLLCLVLERHWRTSGRVHSVGLGVLIGVSALVRTMNALIVPAVLVSACLERRSGALGRALLIALGTFAILAPWELVKARTEIRTPCLLYTSPSPRDS